MELTRRNKQSSHTEQNIGVRPIKRKQGRPPLVENPKERILERAAEHFARNGYDASSINELAKSLKVSKAAIYHYYQTKQEIYDAIILMTIKGMVEHVEKAVAASDEPAEQLKLFMRAHAEYFEKHYWGFVTLLMAYGGVVNVTRNRQVLKWRDRYEFFLRQILAEGMKRRVFKKHSVPSAGRAVMSLLGWMARWYRPGGDKSAAHFALEYYDMVMLGLLQKR